MPEAHWRAVHDRPARLRRLQYRKWSFAFLAELAEHLGPFTTRATSSFLEVGCAPGRFLIYFHQVYGWRVAGIELTEAGLVRTRALLAANGLEARLYRGDILKLRPDQHYDIVGAFGLLEHFDNPLPCYRAMSRWLQPGGALMVTVPNLHGPLGRAMRFRDQRDYHAHQRFRPQDLAAHCRQVGLRTIFCGLVGNFSIPQPFTSLGAPITHRLANMPIYAANRLVGSLAATLKRPIKLGCLTAYVGCVAVKDGQR